MKYLFTFMRYSGLLLTVTYDSKSSPLLHELDKNYKIHFPLIFRYGYHVSNNTEQLDYVTEALRCHYFDQSNISQSIHGFSKVSSKQSYKLIIYLFTIHYV